MAIQVLPLVIYNTAIAAVTRFLPYAIGTGVAVGATWLLAPEIVSVIGGTLLSIAASILIYAGNLFNLLVEKAIIDFPETLRQFGMMDGINTVWTVFRDIANIVIIGMFVFIAISIILGNKEYGQKRLIASVLIIAILINFSLLFTKMIIDGGNFTAYQFYNSASFARASGAGGIGSAEPGTSIGQTSQSAGVAGAFLQIIGVTGLWDTMGALHANARGNGSWSTLGWALVATVLILMAAGVFLYGSFIIVARALLLVFVMITGPLAFASHLIPGLSKGAYGWSAWWKSLIRGAFFAPLLMIFLWASLIILSTAQGSGGTLGGYLTNPTNTENWRVMMVYLFAIGLLFISIKLASSFAATIGGFNIASMVTAAPFTLGSQLAGFGLRNTVGRWSALAEKRIGTQATQARLDLAKIDPDAHPREYARVQAIANRLEGRKRLVGWFAKQNYNAVQLAQTPVGKYISKTTGITSPIAAGDAKASFAESAKKVAEAATARAEAAYNLTRNEQEKMREQAYKEQMGIWKKQKRVFIEQEEQTRRAAEVSEQQAAGETARLEIEKKRVQEEANARKAPLEAQKTKAEEELGSVTQKAEVEKATINLTSDVAIKGLRDQLHMAPDQKAKGDIERQIREKEGERQGLLRTQQQKIEEAENAAKGITSAIQTIERGLEKSVTGIDERRHELEKNAERDKTRYKKAKEDNERYTRRGGESAASQEANAVVQDAINALKEPGAEAAERYATNIISRMLRRKTYKGGKARGMFEERQGKTRVRRMLEETIGDFTNPATGIVPPPSTGPRP